jgi:hypothetical protein
MSLYSYVFISLLMNLPFSVYIIVSPTTLSPAATPVPTVVSTAAEEEEVSIHFQSYVLSLSQ